MPAVSLVLLRKEKEPTGRVQDVSVVLCRKKERSTRKVQDVSVVLLRKKERSNRKVQKSLRCFSGGRRKPTGRCRLSV
jgi:hypothetical protein